MYHTTTEGNETLVKKMDVCLDNCLLSQIHCQNDSKWFTKNLYRIHLRGGGQLCVSESLQIICLIDDVNKTSCCSTPNCNGMFQK